MTWRVSITGAPAHAALALLSAAFTKQNPDATDIDAAQFKKAAIVVDTEMSALPKGETASFDIDVSGPSNFRHTADYSLNIVPSSTANRGRYLVPGDSGYIGPIPDRRTGDLRPGDSGYDGPATDRRTYVGVPTPAAGAVAEISVRPSALTLNTKTKPTGQLSVEVSDVDGNVLTDRTVTFASDDTDVATVDGTGLVTGLVAGLATVAVACEGQTAEVSVVVR